MSAFLSSGSAIERSMICDASVALPHAHYESPYTVRGTAIHEFLEACSKVGREDALAQVDEEFRDACAELNLEGLHDQLSLAAEVSFAYNFETDTARELGRGQGRAYDDVEENEIPCTLDVVGVRDINGVRVEVGGIYQTVSTRRGKYVEWKSGYSTRRRIAGVVQIDFGALCVARAYGCDVVEGELVHVHEDIAPWVQRKVIASWELDAFASEVRERARAWLDLRKRFIAGEMPRDFNTGEWCDRCPAREFCPAQSTLIRHALNARDNFDGPLRTGVALESMHDNQLARLLHDVREARGVLKLLEGRIIGIASARPIYLGRTADGLDSWIGTQISDGNEKLDGEHVFDVLAAMPVETWRDGVTGEDVATKATKVTATKKDLDAAVKDAVPRGKKAGTLRAIFEALDKVPGAITVKTNVGVKEYTTKPAIDQLRALTAPQIIDERQLAEDDARDRIERGLDEIAGPDNFGRLTPEDEAALANLEPRLPRTDDADLDPET